MTPSNDSIQESSKSERLLAVFIDPEKGSVYLVHRFWLPVAA
jgi:hypothetical protein